MTAQKPIRIGFLGLGRRGRVILKNLLECGDRFELAAICDENTQNMEGAIQFIETIEKQQLVESPSYQEPKRCFEIAKVPRYTDWQKMLADNHLEALVIATATYSHYEIILEAFTKQLHVYSEKPLAPELKKVREIIEASEATGKVFQVGLQMRYSPIFQKVKALLEAGEIGLPQMLYLHEFRKPFTFDWQYLKEQNGGSFSEKCIHHFDLFNWFAGAKAQRVFASGGQDVVRKGNIIDNAWVIVDYENGARASLGLSLYSPGQSRSFGIAGTKGTLHDSVGYENIGGTSIYELKLSKETSLEEYCGKVPHCQTYTFPMNYYLAHTRYALMDFAECIRSNKTPLAACYEALEASKICFAAEKSIEEKRPVDLAEL